MRAHHSEHACPVPSRVFSSQYLASGLPMCLEWPDSTCYLLFLDLRQISHSQSTHSTLITPPSVPGPACDPNHLDSDPWLCLPTSIRGVLAVLTCLPQHMAVWVFLYWTFVNIITRMKKKMESIPGVRRGEWAAQSWFHTLNSVSVVIGIDLRGEERKNPHTAQIFVPSLHISCSDSGWCAVHWKS